MVRSALAFGINAIFERVRDENPFFDAFEEWLFHPVLTTLMVLGLPVAVTGAVLVIIAVV